MPLRFRDALMIPELAAIGFRQGIEMIVVGGEEDGPALATGALTMGMPISLRQMSRPVLASMQITTPKPLVT